MALKRRLPPLRLRRYIPFGERVSLTLRAVRQARGLSQSELAKRAKLRRARIDAIERGTANFRLETIQRLFAALDWDLVEMRAIDPKRDAPPSIH